MFSILTSSQEEIDRIWGWYMDFVFAAMLSLKVVLECV